MRFSPRLGFLMQAIDVGLQLLAVDSPDPTAADLDGGELARTHEGIDLRDADAQIGGYVFERQETRLDVWSRLFCRRLAWHRRRIPTNRDGYMDLTLFAAI